MNLAARTRAVRRAAPKPARVTAMALTVPIRALGGGSTYTANRGLA
jgi:hypothetical protein